MIFDIYYDTIVLTSEDKGVSMEYITNPLNVRYDGIHGIARNLDIWFEDDIEDIWTNEYWLDKDGVDAYEINDIRCYGGHILIQENKRDGNYYWFWVEPDDSSLMFVLKPSQMIDTAWAAHEIESIFTQMEGDVFD